MTLQRLRTFERHSCVLRQFARGSPSQDGIVAYSAFANAENTPRQGLTRKRVRDRFRNGRDDSNNRGASVRLTILHVGLRVRLGHLRAEPAAGRILLRQVQRPALG